MSNIYEFVSKGGPVMWPLVGLSVMTIGCALERANYWWKLISQEDRIVHDVLEAARSSLDDAASIAYQARSLAIGRFLFATLRLKNSSPETFHLAMEAAAEREFIQMRKGDKLLETVIAIAPLLGLLGTVTGLMATFGNMNIGGSGAGGASATKAAAGIGEALTATASGMFVAILALAFFRVFVTLQSKQIDYFTNVGNQLELIYRHVWCEGHRYRSEEMDPDAEEVTAIQLASSTSFKGRRPLVNDIY